MAERTVHKVEVVYKHKVNAYKTITKTVEFTGDERSAQVQAFKFIYYQQPIDIISIRTNIKLIPEHPEITAKK